MITDDQIFPDKYSYQQIWEEVICPTIEVYQNRFAEITVAHNAEEAIWEEYTKFNRQCKTFYMLDAEGRLDRHKVCACYMYAITRAGVMSCQLADSNTEKRYLALNENLAITAGMSLLRAFVLSSIHSNEKLSDQEKETLSSRIDGGIVFPACNHGVYRENFASELHYTNEERNYNILSLANTLFMLETYTLQKEAVHKQEKKVVHRQEKKNRRNKRKKPKTR